MNRVFQSGKTPPVPFFILLKFLLRVSGNMFRVLWERKLSLKVVGIHGNEYIHKAKI